MKRELVKGLTMLMLVVALALATAVASANAQSANKVVANVPFDFSVGYKTMPAGQYAVRQLSGSSSAVIIQSVDGKSSALRLSDETERNRKNTHARLVFHRYGQHYFLAEVWNGSDDTGRQLLKSQEERAAERELASIAKSDTTKSAYETIEIVASLR